MSNKEVQKKYSSVSKISDTVLNTNFHWPSDEDNSIWRRLTNYILLDKRGYPIDDMTQNFEDKFRARGTLLARPGSNYKSIENVEINFVEYAIDFGLSEDDAARGYWLKAVENEEAVWYKMEIPHEDYKKWAVRMEDKVAKFLAFNDTITKGKYNNLVMTNEFTGLKMIKMSIKDFHEKTNEAFDLEFIKKESLFVFDHMNKNIDAIKSLRFLKSMRHLGKKNTTEMSDKERKESRKDFFRHFPVLKDHYKKEAKKKMDDKGE